MQLHAHTSCCLAGTSVYRSLVTRVESSWCAPRTMHKQDRSEVAFVLQLSTYVLVHVFRRLTPPRSNDAIPKWNGTVGFVCVFVRRFGIRSTASAHMPPGCAYEALCRIGAAVYLPPKLNRM